MFSNITIHKKKLDQDTLRIDKNVHRIKGQLSLFRFRDQDTRQIVFYIPSLELTGYGATEEKASEMIKFAVDDYFQYIGSLSAKEREIELSKLGWKHNPYKNKEFSKAYVDFEGNLKNFNAVGDQIEQVTLVA